LFDIVDDDILMGNVFGNSSIGELDERWW